MMRLEILYVLIIKRSRTKSTPQEIPRSPSSTILADSTWSGNTPIPECEIESQITLGMLSAGSSRPQHRILMSRAKDCELSISIIRWACWIDELIQMAPCREKNTTIPDVSCEKSARTAPSPRSSITLTAPSQPRLIQTAMQRVSCMMF